LLVAAAAVGEMMNERIAARSSSVVVIGWFIVMELSIGIVSLFYDEREDWEFTSFNTSWFRSL
jgi:hypothetical protein